MKILFLSFYYQPDLCAGSFRATALVNSLLDQLPIGSQVDLITTLPNRYSSFTSEAKRFEALPGLTINRIVLPTHNCGFFDQSRAFLVFARGVLSLCKSNEYDLVFATSSRLMTAVLGAWVSKSIKKPLYLDIRDIFVDTIKDVLPRKITWAINPVFSMLERWSVRGAKKVNLVSSGFIKYFHKRYPQQDFVVFTNGIDDEFIRAQPVETFKSESKLLRVIYAGNMGEGQGLHAILPQLGLRFTGRLHFKLIGDGGRKQELISAIELAGCTNIEIVPPMKRDELLDVYKSADILFLHLNDYEAFTKVLPSKLFEYGALGKPIWAGVAGYAADFIKENISNAVVFKPCDVEDAVTSFDKLLLVTQPRHDFVYKYARVNIMRKMAADVISLAGNCKA